MSEADRSIKGWERVYDSQRPLYSAFLEKLDGLLRDLFDAEDLSCEQIYTHLLESNDFYWWMVRAARGGRKFEDPVSELPGFATITVIVADNSRARTAADIISAEFAISHEEWIAPDRTDGAQVQFARYVVSIDGARAQVSDWRPYTGLAAAVRVQTTLQAAWEELDNDLPYYDQRAYPTPLRESRVELKDVLESANDRFDQIWPALEALEEEYAEQIASGRLDAELSGPSYKAYLRVSETVAELTRIGLAAGLSDPENDEGYTPEPHHVETTLWLADRNELNTVADLDGLLVVATDRAASILSDIAKVAAQADFEPWALPDSIIEWLVLVLNRADARTVELMAYTIEVEDAVNIVIGNPLAPREEN